MTSACALIAAVCCWMTVWVRVREVYHAATRFRDAGSPNPTIELLTSELLTTYYYYYYRACWCWMTSACCCASWAGAASWVMGLAMLRGGRFVIGEADGRARPSESRARLPTTVDTYCVGLPARLPIPAQWQKSM
eukprot:scaffold66751_cov66-Phaeocystis_antarctica.AAC.1